MKKRLLLSLCFACTVFFYTNAQINKVDRVLVYFVDGVQPMSTIMEGKEVKKAKITNASIRNALIAISVPEDSVKPAFPQFNRSDTLRIL